jgi:hypothetical protein
VHVALFVEVKQARSKRFRGTTLQGPLVPLGNMSNALSLTIE